MANEIDRRIRALPEQTTEPVRRVRREFSERLRAEPPEELLALGEELIDRHRWVGYELIANHETAMQLLDAAEVESLGRGIDSWWRRAALVSTVALNDRSRGGTGDTMRTLDICARLVPDRDDMVIKALSWALRELVPWDPDGTLRFLADHDGTLAARVKREVQNKLTTGLKNPKR